MAVVMLSYHRAAPLSLCTGVFRPHRRSGPHSHRECIYSCVVCAETHRELGPWMTTVRWSSQSRDATHSYDCMLSSEPENRVRKTYKTHTSGLATRKVQLLRSLMRCTHHLCMAELLLLLS